MRIEKQLRRWVMDQVDRELERDDGRRRKDVIRSVLAQYARSGDAERYMRPDGHIAWRGTAKFREFLREDECNLDEFNDAAD